MHAFRTSIEVSSNVTNAPINCSSMPPPCIPGVDVGERREIYTSSTTESKENCDLRCAVTPTVLHDDCRLPNPCPLPTSECKSLSKETFCQEMPNSCFYEKHSPSTMAYVLIHYHTNMRQCVKPSATSILS